MASIRADVGGKVIAYRASGSFYYCRAINRVTCNCCYRHFSSSLARADKIH